MPNANLSRKRRWSFRLTAIALGLLPFLVLELTLRVLQIPSRPAAADPFVDLDNLQPLFTLDRNKQRYSISSDRLHLFKPTGFSEDKEKSSYRVFALGGSTTQGEPFSTETAFPKWLEINLQLASRNKDIEVINCGGLSYASYRVLAILREVLTYSPDLIVVYTGHNEFLEARDYEGYQSTKLDKFLRQHATRLQTVQLLRSWFYGPAERSEMVVDNPTTLPREVDALLD